MSQTIVSVFSILLAQLLPMMGVTIGSDQLTTTIQVIVTIIGATWIYVRRVQVGDVKISGIRK